MNPFESSPGIKLAKVEAIVLRAPITKPVQTSFGVMHERPAVLVRAEDDEGRVGWGEIWCNFPAVGAEHRARVLESCVAPILLERSWRHPSDVYEELTRRLRVLALQTGEFGTFAQTIAGVDIALWDLAGKKANKPIWKLLGGESSIKTYASGISPTEPENLALEMQEQGYRAFKLKVGFGVDRDIGNMRSLRSCLGSNATLMVDANQAWDLEEALKMSNLLAQYSPLWLEEPLAADSPLEVWLELARNGALPLAAGENMRGDDTFTAAIASGAFSVIQPDLGKWGGFSGCVPVAKRAIAQGRMYCPHWLGGGIGLIASMHGKAAVGGAGYVEVDVNPNPLRDLLAYPVSTVSNGVVTLPDTPGLGVAPDFETLREFIRPHWYA